MVKSKIYLSEEPLAPWTRKSLSEALWKEHKVKIVSALEPGLSFVVFHSTKPKMLNTVVINYETLFKCFPVTAPAPTPTPMWTVDEMIADICAKSKPNMLETNSFSRSGHGKITSIPRKSGSSFRTKLLLIGLAVWTSTLFIAVLGHYSEWIYK